MDDRIKLLLVEVYPDEASLLGEHLLNQAIRSQATKPTQKLEGGDEFDLAPVYEHLRMLAQAIKRVIEMYDAYRAEHSKTKFEFKSSEKTLTLVTSDQHIKEEIAAHFGQFIKLLDQHHKPADE